MRLFSLAFNEFRHQLLCMIKYILIILFLSYSCIGRTQSEKQHIPDDNLMKTSTDSVVQKSVLPFMSNSLRVGLSVGIYQGGKTNSYHYGSTQKGEQILPTNRTLYEIGSISKTFTGTLLAQAVKDKKVNIDDDIRLYLDGSYPNLEYQGYPIRLSHLLSHISGLPNLLPDIPNLFENTNPDSLPFVITRIQNNYSKKKFLSDLHKVKLDTLPGYDFHYSNSGAQLLKFILEKVYKKPYADLLTRFILLPLGMNATNSLFKKNDVKNLAKGYNSKGSLMPYNPQILDAAGGIFSTIPDMLQYIKYHLNEENEVVALSHKPTVGDIADYAVGLNWQEKLTEKKNKKIWQSGGTFGFSSYCVIYPELNIGIVLLTNEADRTAQGGLEEIADEIFKKIGNQ
jgi:serine-type D-Ala-D-Ala carboxypeptidase/endopeptidase